MKGFILVVLSTLVAAYYLPVTEAMPTSQTAGIDSTGSPSTEQGESTPQNDTYEESEEFRRELAGLCDVMCPALDCQDAIPRPEISSCECRNCDLVRLQLEARVNERSVTSSDTRKQKREVVALAVLAGIGVGILIGVLIERPRSGRSVTLQDVLENASPKGPAGRDVHSEVYARNEQGLH